MYKDKIEELISFCEDLIEITNDISFHTQHDRHMVRNHYINQYNVHTELNDYYYLRHEKRLKERAKIWLMIGKRLGVCKDIRIKIANEIKDQIKEYDPFDEEDSIYEDVSLRFKKN